MSKPDAERATASPPSARSEHLIVRELDGEVLIYDLKRDRATALNAFAAQVWRACDGASDARAIAGRLNLESADYFETEAVERALAMLAGAGLLEGGAPPTPARPGEVRSRRTLLTAVGAGAAFAVVSTLAAPAAAASASCGKSGAPCTGESDCCIGFSCNGLECIPS